MKTYEVKIDTKYPVAGISAGYVEVVAKNKAAAIKTVRDDMKRNMVFDRRNPGVYTAKEI